MLKEAQHTLGGWVGGGNGEYSTDDSKCGYLNQNAWEGLEECRMWEE